MKLLDYMGHSGERLFRTRSYAPLLLLPLALVPLLFPQRETVDFGWEIVAVSIALLGQALRCYISGTAPDGTSERSTTAPRAALLNTLGAYSVVRHPLYVANTISIFGLALFPARWDVAVITLLAACLYYERVAIREELFLEAQFGDAFREWAGRVPAVVPRVSGYRPSTRRFSGVRALRSEFHGILAIAATVIVFDLLDDSVPAGAFRVSAIWLWFFAAASALFLFMVVRKRTLAARDERRHPLANEAPTPQ